MIPANLTGKINFKQYVKEPGKYTPIFIRFFESRTCRISLGTSGSRLQNKGVCF